MKDHVRTWGAWVFALALLGACGGGAAAPRGEGAAAIALTSDGRPSRVGDLVAGQALTVFFFIAPQCPVQKAHEARLRALVDAYRDRGVAFGAVSSEVDADPEQDRALAARLGVPLYHDRGAKLADAVEAEYSTHTVLFDRGGRLLYSGGFDSERTRMTDDAEPYAKAALDAALAGAAIAKPKTEALGCPLRKR